MIKNIYKIVENKDYPEIGRCVHCEARDYCGPGFGCKCTMKQHYVNIQKERKRKLLKLNERKII